MFKNATNKLPIKKLSKSDLVFFLPFSENTNVYHTNFRGVRDFSKKNSLVVTLAWDVAFGSKARDQKVLSVSLVLPTVLNPVEINNDYSSLFLSNNVF